MHIRIYARVCHVHEHSTCHKGWYCSRVLLTIVQLFSSSLGCRYGRSVLLFGTARSSVHACVHAARRSHCSSTASTGKRIWHCTIHVIVQRYEFSGYSHHRLGALLLGSFRLLGTGLDCPLFNLGTASGLGRCWMGRSYHPLPFHG